MSDASSQGVATEERRLGEVEVSVHPVWVTAVTWQSLISIGLGYVNTDYSNFTVETTVLIFWYDSGV